MSKLRRRLDLIARQLPPPEPSALERLIGLYDILIVCTKRSEKLGHPCPFSSSNLRARRSEWKKYGRSDPIGTIPHATKVFEAWRAKLLPILQRIQQNQLQDTHEQIGIR